MAEKKIIEKLRVTSPCSQDWNSMKGNDKARFCEHCDLSVNNLSAMTRKQALHLVRESSGEICVRYIENPRNKLPVFSDKLHQIVRRAGVAAGVLSASLAISTVTFAQGGISSEKHLNDKNEVAENSPDKTVKPKQTKTGIVSGTITDPNDAVIPAAIVSLFEAKNNQNRATTADDKGFYEFKDVADGDYTIKIEAPSFTNAEITGIKVENGNDIKQDKALEIGELTVIVGGAMFIDYEQPLLRAVSGDEINEVKSLLVKGANVNAKDKNYNGITALFVAVENGDMKTVETLLNFGAKINARDNNKRTPLMSLDDDASIELVNLLMSYGAKINAVDREVNSVLIFSASRVTKDVLQFLLNQGAKVNAQNKDGQTALMNAAEADNLENVKILLAAGADVNLKNSDDEMALSLTADEEIIKLLESYGATFQIESESNN